MTILSALCSTEARHDLEQGDPGRCLAWSNQTLPVGCEPATARVGVELTDSPIAKLLVGRGIRYAGTDGDLRRWFTTGELEFDTLTELFAWLDWLLANERAEGRGDPVLAPAQLTELDQVEPPSSNDGPVFVDADALAAGIREEIIGQDEAVASLAQHVREHFAQARPERPLTMMAVGPTGVGKTATAERLAAELSAATGRNHRFLRLDMNEYRERHQVASLLGSPHGYVGHGETTPFGEALGAGPAPVILFDEIDKAHRQVLDALMNAMDAGRFTVSGTTTYDCRGAVFIFTSNQRADEILSEAPAGTGEDEVDAVCRRQLRAGGVRPELVGRITSFLLFRPLGPEAESQVATLAVRRTAESYGLDLRKVEPEVISELLRRSQAGGIGVRGLEYQARKVLAGPLIAHAERAPGSSVTLANVDGAVVCAAAPGAPGRRRRPLARWRRSGQ